MTTIDPDILTIAAVVLGEERAELTGWQKDHAVAAMAALGHSNRHIAWALRTTHLAVYEYARKRGITTHTTDQRLDWPAIDMVVTGAARIHLRGADREEAVRLMAPNVTVDQIAYRLKLGEVKEARDIAKRLGITLIEGERWSWQAYMSTGKGRTVRTRRAVPA